MMTMRAWRAGLVVVALVYLHDTLRYLTMLPRVNVDEPWLMERAYQVMRTGIPSQPMLGLQHAYLLQVGYGYLLAAWMAPFGVGILQARLLGVVLGLGIIAMVAWIGRRTIDAQTGLAAALFLALDSNFLGGARNARTDIPSVFFATAALAAYLLGREKSQKALVRVRRRQPWSRCALSWQCILGRPDSAGVVAPRLRPTRARRLVRLRRGRRTCADLRAVPRHGPDPMA